MLCFCFLDRHVNNVRYCALFTACIITWEYVFTICLPPVRYLESVSNLYLQLSVKSRLQWFTNEQARIQWMRSLALDLGGPDRANDMISGKGISLILKEISLKFRRPVLYPDTVRSPSQYCDLSYWSQMLYLATYCPSPAQSTPDTLWLRSCNLVVRPAHNRHDFGFNTNMVLDAIFIWVVISFLTSTQVRLWPTEEVWPRSRSSCCPCEENSFIIETYQRNCFRKERFIIKLLDPCNKWVTWT